LFSIRSRNSWIHWARPKNSSLRIKSTSRFNKDFSKLDPDVQNSIKKGLEDFLKDPLNPPLSLEDKKLNNKSLAKRLGHVRSFKPQRNFRIIYIRGKESIEFILIGDRKDVYKKLNNF